MNIWKEAIRKNYMFITDSGKLSTARLFTATDDTLTKLENDLKAKVEAAAEGGRFKKVGSVSETLKVKLAIVTEVIDTLIEEREIASNESAIKAEEQRLLRLLKNAEDVEESKLSPEELKKKIADLRK